MGKPAAAARRAAAWLAVDPDVGLSTAQMMLVNRDLVPVEPERRQWGAWNYVGFWVADSFNINTWMIAGAFWGALGHDTRLHVDRCQAA